MKQWMLIVAILNALFVCADAQTAGVRLEFEVASVKTSPPPDGHGIIVGPTGGPGSQDSTRFACRNMTLANLVTLAYGIQFFQLDAPSRTKGTRFNVDAEVPAGATREQLRGMLQSLLAERFQLRGHFGKKEMSVYALVVGKNGPKFKPAVEKLPAEPRADNSSSGPRPMKSDSDGFPLLPRPGFIGQGNKVSMWLERATMADLGQQFSNELGRLILDGTGLQGDFEVRMSSVQDGGRRDSEDAESDAGPSLIRAIQEQLGLKLEARRTTWTC
jgi:uncharacterized protein (TIGR03435 family)